MHKQDISMTFDDDINIDDIDFNKQKRGKGKNKPSAKRWSFFIIEGIIVLVAVVAGGRFLFTDNSEVSHLQATIDAQNGELLANSDNPFDRATANALNPQPRATSNSQQDAPSLSAEDLYQRAMDEVENGLTSNAISSLDLAIELNPSYAEAYFERGQLHYDYEQYFYAANDYQSALDNDYDFPVVANHNLGLSNFQQDNYEKAIESFTTAIELDPDYELAYYWRGRAYAESAYYQEGADDMLQSIEKGYDQLQYAYFWIAKAYGDSENYESAIRYYNISITHSSKDCEKYSCWIDYNNRGVASYWLGDYDTAIEDYTSSIQANPDTYPLAFQNRGNAYKKLGNMTSALSDWNTMFLLLEDEPIHRTLNKETGVLRGSLETNESQIHVEFEAQANDTVNITLEVPDNNYLDAMLLIRDTNNNPLAYVATGDTWDRQFTDLSLPETGTYTIIIASDLASSSGEFTLRLE